MIPRKTKFKKVQKGRIPNKLKSGASKLIFGSYGFKAETFGILTSTQIEAARKVIMKHLKKKGKMWVRVFPHQPKTKKPIEVRMGKGKGAVDSWVSKVEPGTILYEFEGINFKLAEEIFILGAQKLPLMCKLVVAIK